MILPAFFRRPVFTSRRLARGCATARLSQAASRHPGKQDTCITDDAGVAFSQDVMDLTPFSTGRDRSAFGLALKSSRDLPMALLARHSALLKRRVTTPEPCAFLNSPRGTILMFFERAAMSIQVAAQPARGTSLGGANFPLRARGEEAGSPFPRGGVQGGQPDGKRETAGRDLDSRGPLPKEPGSHGDVKIGGGSGRYDECDKHHRSSGKQQATIRQWGDLAHVWQICVCMGVCVR